MKQDLTEIVIVLDRSGSMAAIQEETVGGYNNFIDGQKKLANVGEARVTLIQFDDQYECVYADTPIQNVPALTKETFVPRGMTALLDAVGKATKEVSARILATQKALRPGKVLVVIITDGGENSSKEYTYKLVHKMITDLRTNSNFEFVFLAANIDEVAVAASLGIMRGNAASYASTGAGTAQALHNLHTGTQAYRGQVKSASPNFWSSGSTSDKSK